MFKHIDDRVIIEDGNGRIRIPFSEFQIDEPGYSLPVGAVGRMYNGIRHKIIFSNKDKFEPLPYADGEKYIGRKQFYLDQIAIRHPVPPPPPPLTDEQKIDEAFPQTGTQRVLFKILFKIINRVLALETPPSTMTPAQFKAMLIKQLED